MPDLHDVLEKADRVVDSAIGVIEDAGIERFAGVVSSLRARALYPEEVTIVGLAGGTGSGKSSLFNAIISEPVAEVGGLRPTTEAALASVPRKHSAGLRRYLEELEVEEIVEHDEPSAICVIDLPDTDSVELAHRAKSDAILPRVDVVIWVTDPEKYRDAALHDRYVRPLAGHGRHFLFVLNQVDRLLDPSTVMADFEAALRTDGIPDPQVFATAAGPPAGPPLGVDALVEMIGGMSLAGESGLVALAEETKRLADLATPPAAITEELSVGGAAAVAALMAGDRAGAGRILTETLAPVGVKLGGPQADALHGLQAAVPDVVSEAAAVTEEQMPRWVSRRRRDTKRLESEARVAEVLEGNIFEPVRRIVEERTRLHALLTDLAISVRSKLDRPSR